MSQHFHTEALLYQWRRRCIGLCLMATANSASVCAMVATLVSSSYSLLPLLFVVPTTFALGVAVSGTEAVTPKTDNVVWLNFEVLTRLCFVGTSGVTAIGKATSVLFRHGSIEDLISCCVYIMAAMLCVRYQRRNSATRARAARGLAETSL